MKSGKISGQKDSNGSWAIDPSELHRVFPPVLVKDQEIPSTKGISNRTEKHETAEELSAMQREIQVLREALSDVRSDRDKWRDMAERLSLVPPIAQGPSTTDPSSRKSWWPWRR